MTRTAMQASRIRPRALAPLAALLSWSLTFSAVAQTGTPNVQHTKNTPDLGLRSELKVDPSTLAMRMTIPLGNYPGRAGAAMPLALHYNSKVWRIEFNSFINGNMNGCASDPNIAVGTECYTTTRARFAEKSVAGWTFNALPNIEFDTNRYDADGQPIAHPTQGRFVPRMTVRFADGSTHELRRGDASHSGTDSMTGIYLAVDSSRLKYEGVAPGTGTLYRPDGSRYDISNYAATRLVDRNGNALTAQDPLGRQLKDTLGRLITSPSFHDGGAHTETHSIPGVGGSPMNYTFDVRELDDPGVLEPDTPGGVPPAPRRTGDMTEGGREVYPDPLFASTPEGRVLDPSTFNPRVLHRIVLPDNTSYTFTYNVYGEIAKVVYPTGGYERYRYAHVPPLTHMTAPYAQANRGVVERHVSASGHVDDEVTWLYAPGETTVADGTRTVRRVHTGYPFGTVVFGFDDPRAGFVYEEAVYAPQSEGGAMLRRTLTDWGFAGPQSGGHPSAKRDPKILRTVELLLDTGAGVPLARSTTYQYGQSSQPLNVTAVTEHAFVGVARAAAETGQISDIPTGAPLRTNETAYKDDPAYNARNLVALPVSTTVLSGGPSAGPDPGVVVARTELYYDELTYSGADMSLLACGATEGREASTPATRGNVTTVGRWLDTRGVADNPSAYIDTHTRYDQCGNPRRTWGAAARGALSPRVSEVEYSAEYQFAYPTQTSTAVPDPSGVKGSPVPLRATSSYDFQTGLILSMTDVNNGTTTTYSYNDPDTGVADPLSRLRRVLLPEGGWTRYDFGNSPGHSFVRTRTAIDASRSTDSYQFFDGLGRPSRSYTYDGSAPERQWVAVKTQHYEQTRQVKVSNPHFRTDLNDFDLDSTSSPVPFTTSTSDPLGRVTSVQSPDGATAATVYVGAEVTVTDQAERTRRSVSDALGRLEHVVEAPGVASYAYETAYEYDALGQLRKAVQGKAGQAQQTRLFTYDSLSRLISATNPENGTVSYEYDDAGALKKKVDARHVRTDYDYDALHRVVGLSYSVEHGHQPPVGFVATPSVAYYYDGKGMPTEGGATLPTPAHSAGRLTAVKSPVSETIYTQFDAGGRVKAHRQVVDPGTTSERKYLMEYGFDLAGNLTSEKYPSGRVVETVHDAAGRVVGVKNQATGSFYVGAAAGAAGHIRYAAHGAVESMRLGNGLWEHTLYNSRLQVTRIGLGASGTDSGVLRLDYAYGLLVNGTLNAAKNNGNVQSQTITAPGVSSPLVQTYEYDEVNRLRVAEEKAGTASNWKQVFTYDHFGNRNFAAGTTSHNYTSAMVDPATGMPKDPLRNPVVDQANNRFKSSAEGQDHYRYDEAGNLLCDAEHPCAQSPLVPFYAYDAENKLRTAAGGSGGGGTSYAYDGEGRRVKKATHNGEVTVFVYDVQGRVVAEYSNLVESKGTRYLTQDHLGSTRVVTDASGNAHSENGARGSRHDFFPFGEAVEAGTGGRQTQHGYSLTGGVRQKFTSQARDNETGLDYFSARYFSSNQGRFTSPDPVLITAARLRDPQRLQLYSYCRNNPLKFVDPNGLDLILANEAARARARDMINKTLKSEAEQQNFTIKGDRVLFDDSKNKIANPTIAYRQLVKVIQTSAAHRYFAVGPGESASATRALPEHEGAILTYTFENLRKTGGASIAYPDGDMDHFVPIADDMKVQDPKGALTIDFYEYRSWFHEVLCHESFNTSNAAAAAAANEAAVAMENLIAKELGLPLRGGGDHDPWNVTVVRREPIPVTQGEMAKDFVPKPLLPVPK